MGAWEPEFDFYLGSMDGDGALVTIDLAAAQHAPLASHPVRLQVRVAMLHPRDDGLRSSEEADALFALEDRLTSAMASATGAVYIGRVVARGYTEFFFYVPAPTHGAMPDLGAFIGSVEPYSLEWLAEADAAWEMYGELYPNAYAKQTIMNRRLVTHMLTIGDQIQVPREVDHMCLFTTGESARAAAEALSKAGFRVDPVQAPEGANETWTLEFHRTDACDGDKPNEFVFEILNVIEPLDGEYDGWGSPVQRQ